MTRLRRAVGRLGLAGALAAAAATGAPAAELEPVDCWFQVPPTREAHCAWLYPGARVGDERVRLPVVRLPGRDGGSRPPVVYVPGGPGYPGGVDQAGIEAWWRWQDSARWVPDLIVYDPRGTGLARPAIDCPEIREIDRASLPEPLSPAVELRRMRRAARACYRRLGGQGYLSAFNSAAQAADLGGLLGALAGPAYLWGVSYGSRLALHAAREHRGAVAGLVLDSVFPPSVNGFLQRPAQFERALDQIAAACAERPDCGHTGPEVATAIQGLLERAAREPIRLTFHRRLGGDRQHLAVTDYRLLWMLFFGAYASGRDDDVARAVMRAQDGAIGALEPLAQRLVETLLDPEFSHPVHFSVGCPEDRPAVDRDAWQAALEAHPRVLPYLRRELQYDVCGLWRAGRLPAAYHDPAATDRPVLLLHGVRDPATLPEWAATLARRLPRAEALIFKGTGHAASFANHCAIAAAAAFLEDPEDWERPACLEKQLEKAVGSG